MDLSAIPISRSSLEALLQQIVALYPDIEMEITSHTQALEQLMRATLASYLIKRIGAPKEKALLQAGVSGNTLSEMFFKIIHEQNSRY